MSQHGPSFIHARNPQFHVSQDVEQVASYVRQNGEAIPNEPVAKVASYLGFLANRDYVNDGILTGDQKSIERQVDRHVIQPEDVPESYFELQRRIAREQGHGYVEITSTMRRQLIEAVQTDQSSGLQKWVEYLGGEDGGYPDWFKMYTWNSITKLGTYDKDKQAFQKRSKGTTAPYPELNREALAYVFDALNKKLIGQQTTAHAQNEQLQQLLQTGNFGKLYAHAALAVAPESPELRNQTKGSWVKFNQTDDPRTARRLSGSLQGHGTGWCTAGESTAAIQLQGGDFYAYYTRDEDGKDNIPRVAIRMEQGEVAEVRGVNAAQELEPVMADITAVQLKDLPGGETYIRKAEDMKRLTTLENKLRADWSTTLSEEEVRFLYELDHTIEGFGYEKDPRIIELRDGRLDRDKLLLRRIIPETIRGQLEISYQAYQTVAEQLGERPLTHNELAQVLADKDHEWQAEGVYDYLVEHLQADGARYNLVVTPNVEASEAKIVALAETFGQEQPFSTHVSDEMYRRNRYSDKQWSGSRGDSAVRFSLIPTAYDSDLGSLPAAEQQQRLRYRQSRLPKLGLRVPSLLDAVSYWYTLRAQGDQLKSEETFDKTYIRHFDLEPQRLGGWLRVPGSYVRGDGRPFLSYDDAEYGSRARLAVG